MKFLIISFFLILTSTVFAQSNDFDLSKKWGIGGGAGIPITFNGNRFDQRADGDFAFNFNARYNFTSRDSITVGYARYEYDHTPTCPRVYDALYINRFAGDSRISPILGIGAGVADIPNYNVDENLKLALRGKLGLEMGINKHLFASIAVDYLYISKMTGERRSLTIGEIHSFVPQLGVHYVFGN